MTACEPRPRGSGILRARGGVSPLTMAMAVELGAVVALPKVAVPGVGRLGDIIDRAGNLLGMTQADPAAA